MHIIYFFHVIFFFIYFFENLVSCSKDNVFRKTSANENIISDKDMVISNNISGPKLLNGINSSNVTSKLTQSSNATTTANVSTTTANVTTTFATTTANVSTTTSATTANVSTTTSATTTTANVTTTSATTTTANVSTTTSPTTTTAANVSTTTSATTTTTTATTTVFTTPFVPTFVPKNGTRIIQYRFYQAHLPISNQNGMSLAMDAMWDDISTAGLKLSPLQLLSGNYHLFRHFVLNISTAEAVFYLQIDERDVVAVTERAIAFLDWPSTAKVLVTFGIVFKPCASCVGEFCTRDRHAEIMKGECASVNNNGYQEARRRRYCEQGWCVFLVLFACFFLGAIIAFASYKTSKRAAYNKYHARIRVIREEHHVLNSHR